ncbi:neurogenic locus notch homolog protein 4 isoform X4 [Pteropus medius]|uniref:neurogenic locus notch homolog protein 4 isoform X4 n=1 Tax=Pteropus vampyrus TaxID=132908 RepID=UPI00196B7779|nr:neurogenic locus notch homolog protein 4 isoform X4 [Pteropus giganteus]
MQPSSLLLLLLCQSVMKTKGLPCGSFSEPCANGGICLSLSQGLGTCQCAPGFLGETCQFPDPCHDTQLCQNGGSCQALLPTLPGSPSPPSPLTPSFFCTCPSGFTGERCQAQLKDPCSSFCSKMGHCYIQSSGRPQCSCLPGWTGEQCQLRDFCSANPCMNGGVCLATYPQIQCRCPPGFEGHACEHDVNECFLDPGPCPEGTSCHNTLGSFQCLCPAGREGPHCELWPGPCPPMGCPNGGTCQLVPGRDFTFHLCLCPPGFTGPGCEVNSDDCIGHQCQNGGTCQDGLVSYTCLCPEAWTGWDCSEDVDECETRSPPRCRNGGTCQNSAGSFHCVCVSGWGGTGCEENLDDCVAATCAPGSTCIDRVGSFSCLCPPGRTGLLCHMEDRCLSQPCHGEAQCSTNPLTGATLCLCQPGYSGPTCHQDLDECQMAQRGSSPCEHGGSCLNTPGSFDCLCPPGYTGSRCEADHDECLSQPCHPGSTCLDLLATFHCLCPPGLEGQLCEVETDECASAPCLNQAGCQDQRNGFLCICMPGFTGSRCEEDINECRSSPCANDGQCQDQPGSFYCECLQGFEGPRCEVEVDECLSSPCPSGASCLDVPGSFFCLCPSGFTGHLCEFLLCAPNLCQPKQKCQHQEDKAHCLCLDGSPGCTPIEDNCTCHHGHCQRSSCVCDVGWTGPECEAELGGCVSTPCAHGATCHPQPSGYNCTCPIGYTGPTCREEVTACHSGPCLNGGSCSLNPGGYSCTCPPSHTGPHCQTSTDHCASAPCLNGGTCVNKPGTSSCFCAMGFQGPRCEERIYPSCADSPCRNMATCQDGPQGPRCLCPTGYTGSSCQTLMDLCAPKPCAHNSHCLQSGPSFQCLCLQGWTGPHCNIPLSSCQKAALSQGAEVSSLCQNGGLCIDSGPSYFCHCPPGFQGSMCQDRVNPCESRPCQHGATCVAQPSGYLCQCAPGYNGQNCSEESDACQSQPCHNHGTCTHKPGGFHCICPPGFVGLRCEGDVDECLDQPCHPTGTAACHSLANAFYCQCLPGHTGQWCEMEIEPCQSQPCSHGGSCEATAGPSPGFICHCPPGFEGPTCSHRVPSCGLHHCHHGGLCLPSPKSGFPPRCACLNGYRGPDCLTPPTSQGCGPPSPCLHNGSCSETSKLGGRGFRCSCPPSSLGPRCQSPRAKGCEGRGGDGACDTGCSGPEGNWDGGDCSLGILDPWKGCPSHSRCWLLFRDGQCHPQCDSEECLFDGYDCETSPTCTPAYDQFCRDHFHNGHCEKGCNTPECGWDGGDCRPEDGDSEWGPSLALLVVLSPPALDQQLLALARVLSLTLRVGLWVRKDSDGRDMVYPYPGAEAEEELGGTPNPSHRERAAPQTQPVGKETDSLSTGFVVVMGVDLSRCGPDHPASRCPWDPGLLLRFLAGMAAVEALEPLLPGPLLAAHPRTGTAAPANQLPWPVLCSPVAGVLLLALGALLVLQLIRRRRREHGALWLPPGFTRKPQTQPASRPRRPPLGEDSIGLKALKSEAEVEDGVTCSGPEEGEAEEMASPAKCQLLLLSGDCQELPQAAMLTPPQEFEIDVPDVDARGPDGVTPLMSAVCCGGVGSGTFQAAWLESPEPWEPLLGGGACPQAHTVGTGETPLHLAARFSRPTAARRLLEAGANPNQPDQAGRTPLHTAVAADAREVCQLLLRSRQTAVDARTEDGTTALMLASRLAVEDLVEELIAAKADVGARDKRGGHPGNASAFEGPGEPEDPFSQEQEPRETGTQESGPQPQGNNNLPHRSPGKTALHWAAAVNNARAASSLLQAGADKDAQDGREQTPLFLAAREGAVEVAQLLLRLGAARELRDQAGLTPGDIARQRNHWDLLTLLEGARPPETCHKDATGAFARARTASGSVPSRRGVALQRCRTLSAGAVSRGGGADLQTRTSSVDLTAHGDVAYSQCRILSKGAGGGPPRHGRRFSAGMRGPRPNPAIIQGRSGVATGSGGVSLADEWPCDWVALGACSPASNTRISPLYLTPSPERGSPQVAWDSPPAHRVIPLSAGGEGQKQKANGRDEL